MATDFFDQEDKLAECQRQLFALQENYYMGSDRMFFREMPELSFQPLGLSGLGGRLAAELRGKTLPGSANFWSVPQKGFKRQRTNGVRLSGCAARSALP